MYNDRSKELDFCIDKCWFHDRERGWCIRDGMKISEAFERCTYVHYDPFTKQLFYGEEPELSPEDEKIIWKLVEKEEKEELVMMIKMFFKDKFTYEIIDDSVTKDDLEKFLKENFISLEIVDDSTEWAAFANYYGVQHGFIDIHAASFAYMVSMFMTGMGVSANTEVFLKEDEIEKEIYKYFLFKKEDEPLTEKELAIHIFHFIFSLYDTRIFEFEYATERLSLKLTPTQMFWFKQVPGDTNKEKFLRLLHRRV